MDGGPAGGGRDRQTRARADPVAGADRRHRHRVRRRERAHRADDAPARQGARGRGDVALPLRQRPGGPARGHGRPHGRPAAAATRRRRARAGRRLAGLPAVAGSRRARARPRASPGVPSHRDAAPRGAVAPAAATEPAGRRRLPDHADLARFQRQPRGARRTGRSPAFCWGTSCSRPACSVPRPGRPRSRSTRATPMSPTQTRRSTCRSSHIFNASRTSCPKTTRARSSNARWKTSSTGWTARSRNEGQPRSAR